MPPEYKKKKCAYCGACVGVCPTGALTLEENQIKIDKDKCIDCGLCITFCPNSALIKKEEKK